MHHDIYLVKLNLVSGANYVQQAPNTIRLILCRVDLRACRFD